MPSDQELSAIKRAYKVMMPRSHERPDEALWRGFLNGYLAALSDTEAEGRCDAGVCKRPNGHAGPHTIEVEQAPEVDDLCARCKHQLSAHIVGAIRGYGGSCRKCECDGFQLPPTRAEQAPGRERCGYRHFHKAAGELVVCERELDHPGIHEGTTDNGDAEWKWWGPEEEPRRAEQAPHEGEREGRVLAALNAPFTTSDGSDDPLRASAQKAMGDWLAVGEPDA